MVLIGPYALSLLWFQGKSIGRRYFGLQHLCCSQELAAERKVAQRNIRSSNTRSRRILATMLTHS